MDPGVRELGLARWPQDLTGHDGERFFDFDLFYPMRHFIRFGTLIGIIPLSIGNNSTFHTFRWKSWPAFASIASMTMIGMNMMTVLYSLLDKLRSFELSETERLVQYLGSALLNIQSIFTYLHFLRKSTSFGKLTKMWKSTCMNLSFRGLISSESNYYAWQVGLISFVCMGSIILENGFYHLMLFPICASPDDMTVKNGSNFWEYYYFHGQGYFVKAGVPYNGLLTCILFVGNKLLIYAATFSDIFIILIAKAVHLKYKMLFEHTRARMKHFYCDRNLWPSIYLDYTKLSGVVGEIETFLSPLIFISFARGVGFLLSLIQQGIAFHSNVCLWYELVYRPWLIIHFFSVLFLICHFPAQIAEEQHKLRKLMDVDLSIFEYKEARRLEYFLSNPPTFSGLGYFRIVRPFIISIGNAILTFEVLILQTSSYSSEPSVTSASLVGQSITGNSSLPLQA